MAGYSIVFGILLIVLGGWGYFGAAADNRSVTALIPAFFGVALLLLGVVALVKAQLRKHVMHAAAALGLLGVLGGVIRLVMKYAKDGKLEGRAPIASGLMALICAVFVGMCVNSFIAARRARAASEK